MGPGSPRVLRSTDAPTGLASGLPFLAYTLAATNRLAALGKDRRWGHVGSWPLPCTHPPCARCAGRVFLLARCRWSTLQVAVILHSQ